MIESLDLFLFGYRRHLLLAPLFKTELEREQG